MASILQQQLAAIAEKSTHQLDLKAQRSLHSQSLLFEPKEAANQTFDSLLQIALDGFEELCLLDSRFTQYARNIFSEQSKNEDRTQMTAKENEELDQVLQSFLGLVSGKLLLRPAQQALEWLVRRFRVHEYNTEHFVLAFLPFHDKSIFPTMLSILPKTKPLPPSLRFLQPYQKSLASVPRHAVLYSAINNQAFFTVLNGFVLSTAKQKNQSATLLGFWASMMAQAINGQLENTQSGRPEIRRQREADVLLRIIPVLQAALEIRDVPELYLGCCMITVILATKLDLEDKVLDSLMNAVAGSWTGNTMSDGFAALFVMAQERSTPALPKSTAQKLLSYPQLLQKIGEASAKYPVDNLFTGLALSFISGRRPRTPVDHSLILTTYFSSTYISEASKTIVAQSLCQALLAMNAAEEDEVMSDLLRSASAAAQSIEFRRVLTHYIRRNSIDVRLLENLLEMPLLLSEAPNHGAEIDNDGDVQMVEENKLPENHFRLLDGLKSGLKEYQSMLDDRETETYSTLLHVFAGICSDKSDLETFGASQIFERGDSAENILLLTFLMRVWSGHSAVSVRQNALKLAKKIISGPEYATMDLQALIPYCIIALSDAQQSIRRDASELFLLVSTIYRKAEKAKKLSDMAVLGKSELYGQATRSVKWMKAADVHNVLSEALVETLEEFVVDPSSIRRSIVSAIDGTDDDVELKSSTRSAFFNYLISHAVASPLLTTRIYLFNLLTVTGKASSAGRKQILLPAVKVWISQPDSQRIRSCNSQGVMLVDADKAYVDSISPESEDEFELLRSILTGTLESTSKIRDLVLTRFQSLWPNLQSRQQTSFAQELLSSALTAPEDDEASTDHAGDALALVKQVRLSGDTLVTLLLDVHSLASMPDGAPATKRRRTSSSKTRGQDIHPDDLVKVVRRLTVILELVESSRPERHPELLKHLFHVLGDIQQIRSQIGSDLVYLQQMTISSLLALVDTLKTTPASKMDRSALRADLVVDCMRSTSNSQVHNSALLLISSLASWAPDLVLHSVMPIFTFMSNTILRQGDDYSAHIVDQTVSHVIPPLVSSLRKKNQDLVTGAAELLLSFIAAFEHMPMHRRLQLFKQLILALGPDEALSAVIAMLFERYPSDRRVPGFCAELSTQFEPSVQLKAVIQYIDLVADALQPRRTVSEAIFTFEDSSPEAVKESTATLLSSLVRFLKEETFVQQIRKALDRSEDEAAAVRQVAASLIDRSIGLNKAVENDAVLNATSESVIAAVFNLPPLVHFVKTTASLLEKPEEGLGSRVLESLEARTVEAKSSDSKARHVLLETVPVVASIVDQSQSHRLKLFAISCIDKITEKFGKKNPATILDAARMISAPTILGHDSVAIQVTALFCLSTMVEVLKDDMVSILPGVLTKALESLGKTGHSSDRLFGAVFTLLTTILDYLPWMISSTTMAKVVEASVVSGANTDLALSTKQARDGFMSLAAKNLDMQLLLRAVESTIDKAYSTGYEGTKELISILDKVVTSATKATVNKQGHVVLSVLKQLFDLRQEVSIANDLDDDEAKDLLDELDKSRDAVMMKTILKLNDATFRPFFVQLVEWAMEDTDRADGSAAQGKLQRAASLYGFLSTFFSTLKSLVTSYAAFVLEYCHLQLTSLDANDGIQQGLIRSILDAFSQSFKYDQDDFWQAPAHFSKMSAALLLQLRQSRTIAKEDRIGIIPAIAELASAASSPDHLKELNQELLGCMRSQKTHVRLAAVKCERVLTERLGEDWLALLPEMLPFISELQEDEDEGVERETLAWIKGIEGILGESLEGMLQ
ncbi:hypothetical protein ANO11243_088070 [Dothideomycetidae sp. 11243]|nr:hypothetical protein ANO11243_088070 [fungal sp. No.11243]